MDTSPADAGSPPPGTGDDMALPPPQRLHWSAFAACRGRDTEDWFPDDRKTVQAEIEVSWRAKTVCVGCPVRAECLEYAYATNTRYGVYGGTTPLERAMVERDPDRVAILLADLDVQIANRERGVA